MSFLFPSGGWVLEVVKHNWVSTRGNPPTVAKRNANHNTKHNPEQNTNPS